MTLAGFDSFSFSHGDTTRTVFTRGEGPAVVVIHEIPGITPQVAAFAERVAREGFRTYLPTLLGVPGKPMSMGYVLETTARACISREFRIFASRASSPITDYLRALCRKAHADCGGPGVGVVGMCLTGNFALSLMVDETVMAPVLSQPSLPVGLTRRQRASLHLSDTDLAKVKERAKDGCTVLGLRFTGDRLCPPERFDTLKRELGDAFEGIEIDSSRGNPHGIPASAHSVLTTDLVDEAGHPTRQALDRVLSLFRTRLRPAETGVKSG
ncbi:dienelactone hydrolase family protein [Labilithrix luteola]|uniref:Dienelactone hydrolase family protein n=1 Tax=Labilithrix luteola TaxID=1391654 RepID=A0A0K1Q094_9BACT|nr:dienelactone hydrolase family protein [Labilithrix luteola]AKU98814.1 dienelactone hydrolase family protein [Labilithrix luteola]